MAASDPGEFERRILRSVFGRRLEIYVSQGQEDRIRAAADRYNRQVVETGLDNEPLDPDDDDDLAIVIGGLIDGGLAASEAESGLEGMAWGEIIPAEQAAEARRRRKVWPWVGWPKDPA